MADLLIVRPTLSDDKREELRKYLFERWGRAVRGRQVQVDTDYARWAKAYAGVPLEKERTVPFYKSSNYVVKLIRIYVDTFVARTLNVIFATKPLYVASGLPRELKESWEYYLNYKALKVWDHYKLARALCNYGCRNGSVVLKTNQVKKSSIEMRALDDTRVREELVTYYQGPETRVIPFEDWYVYPFGSQTWEDVVIKFHRVRYPEETAHERYNKGIWQLKLGDTNFEAYLKTPNDIKAEQEQVENGTYDSSFKEFVAVECHLRYATTNDENKLYDIVATIHPGTEELIDLYYNPYPRNLNTFTDYRPFPQDSTWWGESMCELLGQSQEEASVIHNDRRNNSFIANSVTFKRRNGSLLPNPSTNWYPGKVWDLESLDDLEVMTVGAQYPDMIPQEDYVFNLANRLSGIGDSMQGAADGSAGSGGVYNTMGTLAVMAEGNQRQDTNIRDVRDSLGNLADVCSRLQATFGGDDPYIDSMPSDMQPQIRQALAILNSEKYRVINHEVVLSNAGHNEQVERASLLQVTQVLGQYGQTIQQLIPPMLQGKLNPGMEMMLRDIVTMSSSMAKRVMRAFGEADLVEALPDVGKILAAGGVGPAEPGAPSPESDVQSGGPGTSLPPLSGAQLASLSQMSGQVNGAAR